MATIHDKMTSVADKIRTLLGLSGKMGLDAMATNLQSANSEVDTQADLIAQIQTALEGKAAGGGSANLDTCTVTLSGITSYKYVAGTTVDGNGKIFGFIDDSNSTTFTCLCNSCLTIYWNNATYNSSVTGGNVTIVNYLSGHFYIINANPGETITITTKQTDGIIK